MSRIKRPIAERENLVKAFVEGKLSKTRAAELLGCTSRTVGTYAKKYVKEGVNGLVDHRHSNHFKLSQQQKENIIDLKKKDRWRSARNIRDQLKLSVHKKTVW